MVNIKHLMTIKKSQITDVTKKCIIAMEGKKSVLVKQIMSVIEAKFGEHRCWFYLLTIQVLEQSEDSCLNVFTKQHYGAFHNTSDVRFFKFTTNYTIRNAP